MLITFPDKTAKEIVEDCKNVLGKGKLLYDIDWYKNEDFYVKEKCRKGTREVTDEVQYLDKYWNECKELVEKENGEIMNFAETIWFIKCYYEGKKEYPKYWLWTSSCDSDGCFVAVGDADPDGVGVDYVYPRRSYSYLGVVFTKSNSNAYTTPTESDTIEVSIKKVKDAGYIVSKIL